MTTSPGWAADIQSLVAVVADQAEAIACVAAGHKGVNGLDRRIAALLHQLEQRRGPQKIAAVEGIDADVALGEEPTPQHHSPVDGRGAGVNESASQRAIPVGAHDEVEVQCAAREKMQRRAV